LFCASFALALLAPALARAALIPACETHDQLTRMPVEWIVKTPPPSPAESCDAGTPVAAPTPEEIGDPRVPPMCDERGACVVAPPRILPVADDRIEASPTGSGCASDASAPALRPGSGHAPTPNASPALADHAVLDAMPLVPEASSELAQPFPPVAGGPCLGHVRGIDRPPR
jgi:hypothetical protein